ncbi:MAG: helicase-exonuclease AddAB subunit AddA [Lactobacillales bacterium]|jgi:ATP-dependent helicase/nuclease subunit A|nr:helicase-exonuclease AddAB subunit AddA [Lactobacillales bacterium]
MSVEIPLRPEQAKFTDSQWQAIYDGGDNLLVSASAGSGKTTVLVERVIQKIKQGTDVDRLLIVTFTEAAAKEMKERVQVAIEQMINETTNAQEKARFLKQLQLLPTANISTLHAFCMTVIRRFYYLIDMDPVFRMLTDETEIRLLKEDVWEELRESHYELEEGQPNEAFYRLTENFSGDRKDDGLRELIFSLFTFSKANPNPDEWLSQLSLPYKVEGEFVDSLIYKKFIRPALLLEIQNALPNAEQMTREVQSIAFPKAQELCQTEKGYLDELLQLIEKDDFDQAYESSKNWKFATWASPRGKSEEQVLLKEELNQVKPLRDQNKQTLLNIRENYFSVEPEKTVENLSESQAIVEELAKVGKEFMQQFEAAKLSKNMIDFNDLEHFTLNILSTVDISGKRSATEASDYYRAKFDEVLVDEYQDTNLLQESIIDWVAREENRFMVGDVKQSIYMFRLADPTLFIHKYNAYGINDGGRRIVLAENFRSRGDVLDFTNLVFDQLMDTAAGQIEYDEAARLVVGNRSFPETQAMQTEILIYESGKKEVEIPQPNTLILDVEDKTDGEISMVALKIRELVDNGFEIFDKKLNTNRPIRYSDIVLLTPTKKNNLTIQTIFKKLQLPISINDADNYFKTTEIQTMLALLEIIDNPYQDIELAAVLRSPIVGLTEQELAEVRLSDKSGTFFSALKRTKKNEKVTNFLKQLDSWREKARRIPIRELLWLIYEETAYLDYVGGLANGAQRQANLYALTQRAENYEKSSFKGLFQFVRFIEKMQEKDNDLAEPITIGEENAVRVMTFHASKGLEFPIVFLMDLSKKFNMQDLRAKYIFDEKLGIGIKYLDKNSRFVYKTSPFTIIEQAKDVKAKSEEMRKLYVALTRAEQKLFLVGSYENEEVMLKKWAKGAMAEKRVLPISLRLGTNNLMDWIGMTLIRHQDAEKFNHSEKTQTIPEVKYHPAHFKLVVENEESLIEKEKTLNLSTPIEELRSKESPHNQQEQIERGIARLNHVYAYSVATQTATYQSVSELKRIFTDPDEKSLLPVDIVDNTAKARKRYTTNNLTKPKFLQDTSQEILATDIGTASHLLLQLVNLEEKPTLESLEALLQTQVSAKIISEAVAKKVNLSHLLAFFDTEIGQLMLAHPKQVYRERPFSMLMKPDELFKDYPKNEEDEVLIHGIIDGFIDRGDSLILFDYKTDYLSKNVTQREEETVIKRYRGQLELYKKALERAEGKTVQKSVLILLSINKLIYL